MTAVITVTTSDPTAGAIFGTPTTVRLRPRFEGSNICSWIGFKHVNYLVEEAVLEHFRAAGQPARTLYEQYGLGLDIVEIDTRIAHALHQDDLATLTVTPVDRAVSGEFAATVTLDVERGDEDVRAATARVRAVLRQDRRDGPVTEQVPDELASYTVARIDRAPVTEALLDRSMAVPPAQLVAVPNAAPPSGCCGGAGVAGGRGAADPVLAELAGGANSYGWRWRIPYFYCHFTERLQMSGYLRVLEEIVDLFLADRGVSIRTLLDDQNWIPVVPRSTISMLDEALMEEDLYTVFTVEDVFKDLTYTARMDCYVLRDGMLTPTATGSITHGYALIENRRDWRLINFDDRLLTALAPAGS
jgi:acyl-CoA thioesterase FadM